MENKSLDKPLKELLQLILNTKSEEDLRDLLETLITSNEARVITQRYVAAKMLHEGYPYSEIVGQTDVSPFALTRLEQLFKEKNIDFNPTPTQYTSFAKVYDRLTQDVEYDKRFKYIQKIFKKFHFTPNIILDLGCGTGGMSTIMAEADYDVIGVDISSEMLNVASEKAQAKNLDILYVQQPMEKLDLFGTVDAAISLLDSINYLEDAVALQKTLKGVHTFLVPGGLFIFDINTRYKLENVLAGNIFCGEDEDVYYTWENCYDPDEKVCEFKLEFFISENGNITRHTEFHYEKAFEISEIKKLLKKTGFELLAVYDDLTFDEPVRKSEKVFFVARRIG